jgi:sugar phosphate permease
VLAPSLLVAAGLGLAFVPVTIAAVSDVSAGDSGLASGLVNTSRQMGGALGLAILATVATARTASLSGGGDRSTGMMHSALTAGYQRAFEIGAGFAIAGALVAIIVLRLRPARAGEPAASPVAEGAG